MALNVGKIVAAIEIQERYEAQLEKFVRQSERAARVAGDGLTRGGRTAAEALGATGAAADRAAESVAKVDRAALAADKHLAMLGVTAREAADNQRRLAALSDQASERIVRGYTTIDQEHKRFLDKQERMAEAAERSVSRQSSALSGLTRLAVGAFSVERLVAFGRHVVTTASDIHDLAEQTGVGMVALQRYGFAARQSGTDIGRVTDAIAEMSKNLFGGEQSAVTAVRQLGLSTQDLLAMRPEAAFAAIAEAIRRVPDPIQQTNAAMRILGDSGQTLLPMIKAGLEDVGRAAPVMQIEAITALDNMGDRFRDSQEEVTTWAGNVLGNLLRVAKGISDTQVATNPKFVVSDEVRREIEQRAGIGQEPMDPSAWGELPKMLDEWATSLEMQSGKFPLPAVPSPFAPGGVWSPDVVKNLELYIKQTDEQIRQGERARQLAEQQTQTAERLTLAYRQQVALQHEVNRQAQVAYVFRDQDALGWEEYAGAVEQARIELEWYLETVRQQPIKEATHPYTMVGLQGAVSPGGLPAGISTQAGKTLGDAMSVGLKSAFAGIPQLLTQAFTGGGGVVGALKGLGIQIADAITRPLLQRLKEVDGRIQGASVVGAAGAGAIGSAFGPTASLIGGTASAIAGAAMATSTLGMMAVTSTTAMIALSAATLGIGAAAVGVYLLARHFFTVSKEVKQARADVQAFQEDLWKTMTPLQVAEAGGRGWAATLITVRDAYVRMGYEAGVAERLVAQLLDTNKPEAAREAMAQINGVVGAFRNILAKANEQMGDLLTTALDMGQRLPESLLDTLARLRDMGDLTADNIALLEKLTSTPGVDFKKFKEAADRYGINESSLGQAYQQNKATSAAQQMVDDVELLLKGGASMGTVLYGMREEISALVQQSTEFGTTLPENMKPWIEELARSGLLLDKNGEKITDLSQIKFAESLESSFGKVVASIQKLIDMLTGPLQAAFGAIPKNVGVGINVDVNTPGGGQVDPYARGTEPTDGFADGTIGGGSWFRDFGRGTPTVLHGQEAVVRRDQVGAFVSAFGSGDGGVMGGGAMRPVVLKLRDNRVLAEVVAAELDGVLARRGVRR